MGDQSVQHREEPQPQRVGASGEGALGLGILTLAVRGLDPHRLVAEGPQVVGRRAHVELADVACEQEGVEREVARLRSLDLSGPAWIGTVDQRVSWGGPSLDNPGSGAFAGKSGAAFILWTIPGLDSTPGPKGKTNANSTITASTEDAEGVVTLTRDTRVSVFSGGGWDYMKIMDSARTEANKTVGGYDPMFGRIESVEFHSAGIRRCRHDP